MEMKTEREKEKEEDGQIKFEGKGKEKEKGERQLYDKSAAADESTGPTIIGPQKRSPQRLITLPVTSPVLPLVCP